MGWVTPLGTGLEEVWQRLVAGHRAEVKELTGPEGGRVQRIAPVPEKTVAHLGRQPRLRRASPISYYAVAAGLQALEQAALPPEAMAETAVIFAASSGSVLYSRKFYEGYTKGGTASPLLFPETVYNAPASHLAAQLGLDGATYTVVGDTSAGLQALGLAQQLLASGQAEHCVVVGAEELDWVLAEAYRTWALAGASLEAGVPYARPARGALLAEAGAAVVLSRTGRGPTLNAVHPGVPFAARKDISAALARVVAETPGAAAAELVVGSANGSALDAAEAQVLAQTFPQTPTFAPKAAWGEAMGAGALQQLIAAALALQHGVLPPTASGATAGPLAARTALVLCTGLNMQAAGALLSFDPSAVTLA